MCRAGYNWVYYAAIQEGLAEIQHKSNEIE